MMTASTRAHIELSGEVGLALTEGDISSDDPDGFWMRGGHWSFGRVLLSDLAFSPVRAAPSQVGSDDRTYLSIGFLIAGDVTMTHEGAHLRFVPGTAAFLTSIFSLTAENGVPSRVIVVSVPRDDLAVHGVDPAAGFGALSYSALLRDPLLPFLETLLPIIQNHSIPAEPTATMLVQLVAALFIADAAQIRSSRMEQRALRYSADEKIARSFSDPTFTPAVLARRLGVGLAELNTVFDDTGSGATVLATITARRLTRAIGMLGAGDGGADSSGFASAILAAARSSGFSGPDELETAVQQTYGVSTVTIFTGLRRLGGEDHLDQGGVQTFVGRVRRPETPPA